jgi:lysophospholipase L1-like esterase
MIQLKHILLEQESADNKLKVLFVGDSQTAMSSISYAYKLLNDNIVEGDVSAKGGANTTRVLKLLRTSFNKEYDVVCIMAGGNDSWNKSESTATENLSKMYRLVKSSGAIVIALSNPTKKFTSNPEKYPSNEKIAKWVESQSISDFTVPVNSLTAEKQYFLKDQIHLNKAGQNVIYEAVNEIFNEILSGKTSNNSTNNLQQKIDDISDKLPSSIQTAISKLTKFKSNPQTWSDKVLGLIGSLLSNDDKSTEIKQDLKKIKHTGNINANIHEITSFFINKGLTPEQAAGIAGNLKTESEFNVMALGDSGTSFGLAQWHLGRWDNLKKWCKTNGYDPESAAGQLEFLWHELNTSEKQALIKLKQQTTASDSAYTFAKYFERPASISSTRMKNAEDIYNKIS